MHWNHRVIFNGSTYAIHEVYYEDGKIEAWTEEPIRLIGESIEDLRVDLTRMLACLNKEVIDDRPS